MTQATLTSFFGQDHDRLDELFRQFRENKQDFSKAKDLFKQFNSGLKRHIIWEEEILFPVFEQKTGMREVGPTAVMRVEHRSIHQALDGIHGKIRQGSTESDAEEAWLLSVLSQHNQKEENILYPSIDRLVSPEEREEILKRVREYPEAVPHECCA